MTSPITRRARAARTRALPVLVALAPLTLSACAGEVDDSADEAAAAKRRGGGGGGSSGSTVDYATVLQGNFRLDVPSVKPTKEGGKGNYVSLALPYEPIQQLRVQIEDATGPGVHLKDRGEAHVTILSPDETGRASARLGNKFESTVRELSIQSTDDLKIGCVGVGTHGSDQTIYVVVESKRLREIHDKLLGLRDPDPDYHPHITVGYTNGDLHLQDGVVKTVESCPNQDNLGQKATWGDTFATPTTK